jgi:hypothetical protein
MVIFCTPIKSALQNPQQILVTSWSFDIVDLFLIKEGEGWNLTALAEVVLPDKTKQAPQYEFPKTTTVIWEWNKHGNKMVDSVWLQHGCLPNLQRLSERRIISASSYIDWVVKEHCAVPAYSCSEAELNCFRHICADIQMVNLFLSVYALAVLSCRDLGFLYVRRTFFSCHLSFTTSSSHSGFQSSQDGFSHFLSIFWLPLKKCLNHSCLVQSGHVSQPRQLSPLSHVIPPVLV